MIHRAIILALTLILFSGFAGEVIQGPFEFTSGGSVFIENSDDDNYPIELRAKLKDKVTIVDRYETDGSVPIVESIFFKKISGFDNIIVLVSWNQLYRGRE